MKKSVFGVVVATLLLAAMAFGQGNSAVINPVGPPSNIYFSKDYSRWTGQIITGNSATGSQTVQIYTSGVFPGNSTAGVNPLSTTAATAPIQFNGEILTPSAISCGVARPSGFTAPEGGYLCNVTATFANLHGANETVLSGDNGIGEAMNDAASQGGGLVYWVADTGIVTLNTGGLSTTTTAQIPASSFSIGASGIVKTTITGCTGGWSIGVAGGNNFTTPQTTLTAGTTALGKQASPAAVGTAAGLTPVTIACTTANAGAGAVKARVWGFTAVQAAQ